ncbi:MAG TPA: hypothetical protein EYG03_11560 [Planctomycetes bacterium]|nr:hypothetical protein [Fuerstiella sp.]HIK92603.1 hypothetical protein [Planctomycetota bacterium]
MPRNLTPSDAYAALSDQSLGFSVEETIGPNHHGFSGVSAEDGRTPKCSMEKHRRQMHPPAKLISYPRRLK